MIRPDWSSGGIDTFFLLEQHLTFRHNDRDQYETQSEEKTKAEKVQIFRNRSIYIQLLVPSYKIDNLPFIHR